MIVTLLAPAMVTTASAAPIRLLVLGDSLTAGYGLPHEDGFQPVLAEALRQRGIDVTLVDGAVSGDTSAGGLARLDWVLGGGGAGLPDAPPSDAAPLRATPSGATPPDAGPGAATSGAAIVELGANDGLRGLDPAEMERNLTTILDRLDAKRVKVLLSGMYPPPNYGPDYTREFRAVFDRLSKRPGLLYDPFFLDGVALDPSLIQPDGLHPTAQGVARIVARLLPLVVKLLEEARAS